ncbi:MAG: 2-hydroxychromene-2-carboxylate isomerase [Pseudomonadota bacterium]
MPVADWYFDYVSPYPYLQLPRFAEFPDDLEIRVKPVLFAGLLNHWGHLGPAEIPAKKTQTFRYSRWLADKRGVSYVGPPRHPFNPLALLRLTIALGPTPPLVQRVYDHVFGQGNDGQSDESLSALAAKLEVADLPALINDPAVKAQLKANTDEAIGKGVYGVPTFAIGGELFWGDDMTDLFLEYVADPTLFDQPRFQGADKLVPAATRRQKD